MHLVRCGTYIHTSIIWILVLRLIGSCKCVSICQTPVHVNDKQYNFHVDSLTDLVETSIQFCGNLGLTDVDCKRIRDHHRATCFGVTGKTKGAAMTVSQQQLEQVGEQETREGEDNTSSEEQKGHQNQCKASTTGRKGKGGGSVDYSTKVGPIMPIHGLKAALEDITAAAASATASRFGTTAAEKAAAEVRRKAVQASADSHILKTHNDGMSFIDNRQQSSSTGDEVIYLQSYLGETPHSAVKRFCGSKRLPVHICEQIRTAFLQLHGIDSDSDSEADSGCDAAHGGSDSKHSRSISSRAGWMPKWLRTKLRWWWDGLAGVLQPYYGYVLVAIAVLYVALLL